MTRGILAVTLALGVCFLFSGAATAQTSDNKTRMQTTRQDRHRPDRELTGEQKAAATAVLSKYKPETLTADDARSIRRSLRDAGLRGHQMNEALTSAGFDPAKMRELRPAPRQNIIPPGAGPDITRAPGVPGPSLAPESKAAPAAAPAPDKAAAPAAAPAPAAKPASAPAAVDQSAKKDVK